jgi:hypothetical protein
MTATVNGVIIRGIVVVFQEVLGKLLDRRHLIASDPLQSSRWPGMASPSGDRQLTRARGPHLGVRGVQAQGSSLRRAPIAAQAAKSALMFTARRSNPRPLTFPGRRDRVEVKLDDHSTHARQPSYIPRFSAVHVQTNCLLISRR